MLREELTRLFPALTRLPPGCWAVGGAIRDLFLGRDPDDVDVACPDPEAAARSLHERVIRLGGEEHLRAYRVILGEREHFYDFAEIVGGSIEVDLARRDFTVNAMAVSLDDGSFLDPYGGRRDVEARLVRMVRPENFDDDPLRMLKAVRMAVKYGFTLDEATLEAIRQRAQRITEVARERVNTELGSILISPSLRRAIELLHRTGLDRPLGLRTLDVHTDEKVPLIGGYALLLEDPRAHAERWGGAALMDEVAAMQRLIDRHDRLALYDAGESLARRLPPVLRALGRDDRLDLPDFKMRALLTGEEIAALTGLEPGKELGRIKRALLEAQIRGEVTARDEAEAFVTSSASRPPHPR